MIRFSSVTKQFGDNPPALEGVNFDVQKGEFVFLTGPSGSGKTTLLKLITKEYAPTQGEVEFEGVPLSSIRGSQVHQHRRHIGVVFQDYRLLPELNVWENIALALRILNKSSAEIEERVTDLLQLVQLSDKAYAFPAQLSGGEAQRISIARALSTAPSLILADEPTGNLDTQATLMIANLFHKIHQLGTTIIFATHDLSILSAFGHRQIHLDKGHLISDTAAKDSPKTSPAQTTIEHAAASPQVSPAPAKSSEQTPPKKSGFRLPFFSRRNTSPAPPTKTTDDTLLEKEMKEVMVQVEDLDGKTDEPKKA